MKIGLIDVDRHAKKKKWGATTNAPNGKDVKPIKKALHYAIFFNSYELSDALIGVNFVRLHNKSSVSPL